MTSYSQSPFVVPINHRGEHVPYWQREWDTVLLAIIIVAVIVWIFCSCSSDYSDSPYSARYVYERFTDAAGNPLNNPMPGGAYDRRVSGNALMAVRDDPGQTYKPYEPPFGQVINSPQNPSVPGAAPYGLDNVMPAPAIPLPASGPVVTNIVGTTATTGPPTSYFGNREGYSVDQAKQDAKNAYTKAKKAVHNATRDRYTVQQAQADTSSLAAKGTQYYNAAKNWVSDKVNGKTERITVGQPQMRYIPQPKKPLPPTAQQIHDSNEVNEFMTITNRRPVSKFRGKGQAEFFGDFEKVDAIDKIPADIPETAQPELTEDQLVAYIGI
jgi:hypothetical protein